MNKKKKLQCLLVLCVLSAIISLMTGVLSKVGGVAFVVSAVLWGISVIGIGHVIIELERYSERLGSQRLDLHP